MDSLSASGFPLAHEIYSVAPVGSETVSRSPERDVEEEDFAVDRVTLSEEAVAAARALEEARAVQAQDQAAQQEADDDDDDEHPIEDDDGDHDHETHVDASDNHEQFTEEERAHIAELQATDQRVRAHEQAHAAAGAYNVRYDYETGPDGKQYAVGGTAQIDMTISSTDPDGRIREAQKMRNAALAPADPSGEDMAVAAKATRIEMEAQAQKVQELMEEQQMAGNEQEAFWGGDLPVG